jgi:hypothetical protein
MEHHTTHPEHPETPTEAHPSLRRRVTLAAACVVLAGSAVGLAGYGIAGASSSSDEPDTEGTVMVSSDGECMEPLSPEEVAATNEDEDALAAHLERQGIAHTRETDADAIRRVVWDENDEAANDAVDEFWASRHPLSPEDVAEWNAEEDDLAAFLDERGIAYTRETDAYGIDNVIVADDEAAGEAVEEFYAQAGDCGAGTG